MGASCIAGAVNARQKQRGPGMRQGRGSLLDVRR
jgi:hypothetical protein